MHKPMIRTIALALGLASSFVAGADAQTFDGTYRGTRTITRAVSSGEQGSMPDCPGIGGKTTAIEFQVSGSTITLRYLLRSDAIFPGTFGPDGAFTISTPWPTAGGGRVVATWTGRIQGPRLQGTLFGAGGGGECHGTLSARKRS